MNDELRNLLRDAKGRVVKSWGQGFESSPPVDGVCALTSLNSLSGPTPVNLRHEAERVLALAAGMQLGDEYPGFLLYRWNDVPGRTQEEVVAIFDIALAGDFGRQVATPERAESEEVEGYERVLV
jgi:hypothetical protein